MGFGGSASAMISSLKANKKLLKKKTRFDRDVNGGTFSVTKRKALIFKSLDSKGKAVLDRRLAKMKLERRHKMIKVYLVTIGITIVFLASIYILLSYAFF